MMTAGQGGGFCLWGEGAAQPKKGLWWEVTRRKTRLPTPNPYGQG